MHEGTTFFIADIAKAGGFKLSDVKVEAVAVADPPAAAQGAEDRRRPAAYPLSYEAEAAGFSNLGPIAGSPDYQFTSVMVDQDRAKANRSTLVGFLRALRKGTEYMFADPDESAEVGAKDLRTTLAYARRAIDDTAAWTSCRAISASCRRACSACSTSCRRTARSAATCRSSHALRRRQLLAGEPALTESPLRFERMA